MKLLSITRAVALATLVCALPALAPERADSLERAAPRVCQLDFAAVAAPRCATEPSGAALH